jgi:hypothetical protein
VFSSRIRAGVRAGLVSAAATAGAIIGFSVRHNDWAGPFASLGSQVMQGLGLVAAPRFLSSAAGAAAHVSWMVIWGIAFAALAHGKTAATAVLVAVLVGLGAMLAALTLVPAAMGAATFAAMPAIQAALCVALMSAGLVTGRALSPTD